MATSNPSRTFRLRRERHSCVAVTANFPPSCPGPATKVRWVRFAAGVEKEMEMPPLDSRDKFPALSRKEIALLRGWIDQGAKWPTVDPPKQGK